MLNAALSGRGWRNQYWIGARLMEGPMCMKDEFKKIRF